jgi:AcrR family transcriptional regulator
MRGDSHQQMKAGEKFSLAKNAATRTPVAKVKKSKNGVTKERLLWAATELFAEQGFHGSSTREITQRAQTNLSSLYFHWRSKENLYLEVHRRLFQLVTELGREVADLLEQGLHSSKSLDEMTEPITDRVFEFYDANRNLARLNLHRVLDDGILSARIEREFENPIYQAMALCYRRLTEEGLIKVRDPELLSFSLETLLDRCFASPAHVQRSLGLGRRELRVRMRNHFRETFLRLLKEG